jgi:hypothetical protein
MKKKFDSKASGRRKTTVRSETLRLLTTEELDRVAGAIETSDWISFIKKNCVTSHEGC